MIACTKKVISPIKLGRGRPSKHTPKIQEQAKKYLSLCIDVFNMQRRRFDVNLPSIEGFADYLGVNRSTLYRLSYRHPEYKSALELIKREQKLRLINQGLAGNYNSTMAVMMLKMNHGMVPKKELPSYLDHFLGIGRRK